MEGKVTVLCYNKCCGKKFDPSNNDDENACLHHPGVPIFHDAYKSWSCCNKKTTDFTDFLNIKGCTQSKHSNVKPQETVNVKPQVSTEVISTEGQQKVMSPIGKPMKRPSDRTPLQRLKMTVTGSLKSELSKLGSQAASLSTTPSATQLVSPGTACKNGACTKFYESEADNTETCMHHPGFPVFHEGMKYWTCCTRRTTDFDNFLEQTGCTAGKHLWFREKSENDIKKSCRYDWYQAGPYVYITIYAKVPIPEKSYVELNPVKLHAYIVFGIDRERFDLGQVLFGIVDLDHSSVQFAANKVEIKLKKAEAQNWSHLFLPQVVSRSEPSTEDLENNLESSLKL